MITKYQATKKLGIDLLKDTQAFHHEALCECVFVVCRAEEEMQEDVKRRDALSERLKTKDAENTRKIVERSDKKV